VCLPAVSCVLRRWEEGVLREHGEREVDVEVKGAEALPFGPNGPNSRVEGVLVTPGQAIKHALRLDDLDLESASWRSKTKRRAATAWPSLDSPRQALACPELRQSADVLHAFHPQRRRYTLPPLYAQLPPPTLLVAFLLHVIFLHMGPFDRCRRTPFPLLFPRFSERQRYLPRRARARIDRDPFRAHAKPIVTQLGSRLLHTPVRSC
jgi:hypothetical protein